MKVFISRNWVWYLKVRIFVVFTVHIIWVFWTFCFWRIPASLKIYNPQACWYYHPYQDWYPLQWSTHSYPLFLPPGHKNIFHQSRACSSVRHNFRSFWAQPASLSTRGRTFAMSCESIPVSIRGRLSGRLIGGLGYGWIARWSGGLVRLLAFWLLVWWDLK